MNTDKHRLKTNVLSVFIRVHLWPKLSFRLPLESRPAAVVRRNETAYERDRSSPAMKMPRHRLCPGRSEEPTQVIENRLCALHFRKNPISPGPRLRLPPQASRSDKTNPISRSPAPRSPHKCSILQNEPNSPSRRSPPPGRPAPCPPHNQTNPIQPARRGPAPLSAQSKNPIGGASGAFLRLVNTAVVSPDQRKCKPNRP
jgi:hypothetical protein